MQNGVNKKYGNKMQNLNLNDDDEEDVASDEELKLEAKLAKSRKSDLDSADLQSESSEEPLVPIPARSTRLSNRRSNSDVANVDLVRSPSPSSSNAASSSAKTTSLKAKETFAPIQDENQLPEVRKELEARLASFEQVTENQFLCER